MTFRVWSNETSLTMDTEFSVITDSAATVQCVVVTQDNNFAVILTRDTTGKRKGECLQCILIKPRPHTVF